MELACQVIIFGEDLTENLPHNLLLVREAGFKYIQCGPMLLHNLSTEQIAKVFSDQGVRLCTFHCGTGMIVDVGRFHQICDAMLSLQCEDIICSGILGGGSSYKHYEATGELLAKRTQEAAVCGIRLSYHHHDWELAKPFGHILGIDVLMNKATDTGFVINTYWAKAAKVPLIRLWKQHGTRCRIVHLKDGLPDYHQFRPLGKGKADAQEAFDFLKDKQLDYIVWEQDLAQDRPIKECIEISAKWLFERLREHNTGKPATKG
jgi:sugar phosphate isomerase/epimerase